MDTHRPSGELGERKRSGRRPRAYPRTAASAVSRGNGSGPALGRVRSSRNDSSTGCAHPRRCPFGGRHHERAIAHSDGVTTVARMEVEAVSSAVPSPRAPIQPTGVTAELADARKQLRNSVPSEHWKGVLDEVARLQFVQKMP